MTILLVPYNVSIKEVVDRFGQFTAATDDLSETFKFISTRAKPFARLLGPVGTLVALGFEQQFKVMFGEMEGGNFTDNYFPPQARVR